MAICASKIGPQHHISCPTACSPGRRSNAWAPAATRRWRQINDYYYEDLTPESFRQIIDDFRAGKAPAPGSYAGRKASEPAGGPLTLSDPALYDGSRAKRLDKLPNAPQPERVA